MRTIGVIVLVAAAAWSQNVSSSISGTITDQSDTGSNGSMHTTPGMDSIGEVRVLISNYAADAAPVIAPYNHTQFSALSTTARFDTAGTTTQTDTLFLQPASARSPRRIQLAVRFNF